MIMSFTMPGGGCCDMKVLSFWATDCGGCVLEIPSFIELEKAYKDKGFTAVGVAMDISYEGLKDAKEAWGRVRPFMAEKGMNYPIVMGDDAMSEISECQFIEQATQLYRLV
jgi:thiol-disulfide isomerase/thioredoxin